MNPWLVTHIFRRYRDGLGFHVYAPSQEAARLTCRVHAIMCDYRPERDTA